MTAEKQSRVFELEQEKLAANDVLRELQRDAEASEATLKSTKAALEVAEREKRKLETQRVALQVEVLVDGGL